MPSLEKVEKFCRDRSIEMTGHLVTSRFTFMPEKKVEPEDDGRKEIELDDDEFDEIDTEFSDEEEDDGENEEQEVKPKTMEQLSVEFVKAKTAMENAKEAIKRHLEID